MEKWIEKQNKIHELVGGHSFANNLSASLSLAAKLSATAGAATLWYLHGNTNLPFLDGKLHYIKHTTIPQLREAVDVTTASFNKMLWNLAAATEERVKAGDVRLLKAFHMRELTSMLTLKSQEISINALHAQALRPYLEKLAERKIATDELFEGILYKGGKLYSKATGDVILKHAIPFEGAYFDIASKKARKTGLNVLAHAIENLSPAQMPTPVSFIGGKSVLKTIGRLANVGATDLARNYLSLLDNPFEIVGELLHAPVFGEKAGALFNKVGLLNKFGVGGRRFLMNKTAIELIGRHVQYGIPRLLLAFGGFKIADEIADRVFGGGGITGALARTYQGVSLLGSHVSKTIGLTDLSKWQEEKLPGSTSLLGLGAIPASLALTGALASGLTSIFEQFGPEAAHPLLKEGIGYQAGWYKNLLSKIESSDSWLAKIGGKLFTETSGRTKVWATVGALVGTALALPFLPGALGTTKEPDELKKIYRGEELVPIRKGRFWEFSTTSFWGEKIDRFVPHWTVRAIKKADKKAIYGEDYGHPIRRFFKWLRDPYYLEKEHAQDRPYALWGPSEPPLGPIGAIWAHTIGKVLKPPVIVNTELSRASLEEYKEDKLPTAIKRAPKGVDAIPATTGAADMKIGTPYDKSKALKTLIDSVFEAGGLRGYILSRVLDTAKGSSSRVGEINLESSGAMTSEKRAFWDEDLGGMAGTTEFYRRLNRRRRYGEDYIAAGPRNTMPDWLPDEYLTGDAFVKLKQGELRLPGPGFAELYPELKGVTPEEYPAVYRYKVLADVAPWSPQRFKYEAITQRLAAQGKLSQREMDIYSEVQKELEEKEDIESQLNIKPSSLGIAGTYWDTLRKTLLSNPFESLTPLSPAHKFIPYPDAETYLKDMVLDKKIKAWHTPIESFIKPFIAKTADLVLPPDVHVIPNDTTDKDQLDAYFLYLQTAKNKLLRAASKAATTEGDKGMGAYYRSGIKPTLLELNPLAPAEQIARLAPPRYKTVLPVLFNVHSKEEREDILAQMPNFLQPYLLGQWAKNDLIASGNIDELKNLERMTVSPAENFDVSLAIEKRQLPDKNFIGWAPGVNLNALKVKAAEDAGISPYEMGLWSDDIRDAEQGVQYVTPSEAAGRPSINVQAVQNAVQKVLKKYGLDPNLISITPANNGGSFNLHITDDGDEEVHKALRDKGIAYA